MRRGVCIRGVVLALLLGASVAGLVPAGAAARRPTKLPGTSKGKPLRAAPNCAAFEGSVIGFQLGALKGPSVTTIGKHQTTCVWSGQEAGRYGFVVSVAVFGSPAAVGKALLAAAKAAADKANRTPGGLGIVTSRNPRRGNYFEGEALYSEENKNKETDKCPAIFNEEDAEVGQKTAIETGQTGPTCVGQPGTEGDFLTAYGSPLPHGEPMLLQISVACQVDALSGGLLSLGHIASAVYAGRGY
jgi:hypothetical protein